MKSGSAQQTPSAKRAKLRGHGDESAGQSPGEQRAARREHAARCRASPSRRRLNTHQHTHASYLSGGRAIQRDPKRRTVLGAHRRPALGPDRSTRLEKRHDL